MTKEYYDPWRASIDTFFFKLHAFYSQSRLRNPRHRDRVQSYGCHILLMRVTIVHKSTLINAWHRLWRTMMLENEPANERFEGFHASSDKQMVSNIVTYAKILSAKSVS